VTIKLNPFTSQAVVKDALRLVRTTDFEARRNESQEKPTELPREYKVERAQIAVAKIMLVICENRSSKRD
jgi:hypothetical protein